MASIIDRLEHGASAYSDRCLYSFLDGFGQEKERYTYLGFHERTRYVAEQLKARHGLQRGIRVMLVYPPGLELVVALIACARIGAIPVPAYPPTPMNFEAGLARLAFAARDCEATAALTTRGVLHWYALALEKRPTAHPRANGRGVPPLLWIATDDLKGIASNGFDNDPDPVLLLQYTSGSTSEPKGVVVSHDNVIHNSAATLDFVPTCVSWLPQYHDMGLIGYYLYPLLTGGTTFGFTPHDFLRRPALWLETITRVRATHTGAPNFGYDYCLREDKLPGDALEALDLSSLRVMMNAAEPVRPATCERFLARFAPCGLRATALIAAYGLAENTITVAQHGRHALTVNKSLLQRHVLHLEESLPKNNNKLEVMSCGKPVEGVEVVVVDAETRRALGEDRIGEIWVTGESTCRGYWNRAASSAEAFGAIRADDTKSARRYLRTGDLGFMHEGEVFVCGRIKDLIIVRGVNFYPQDIESIVEACSERIRPGGTAAFESGGGDAGLVLAIEVKNAADLPAPADIARAVRARYFIEPHTIVFLPHGALPKTTSGKLSRGETRRRFLDGELSILASHTVRSEREPGSKSAGARQRFQYLSDLYNLAGDEEDSFADIGIDSLTTVELLSDIKHLLEEHGAGPLVDDIDVRLLQRLTVAEFFGLVDRLDNAGDRSFASLRSLLERLSYDQRTYESGCMRADVATSPVPHALTADRGPAPTDAFLTGVTGFFGPFLLSSLLRETPLTIHALTRAAGPAHGMNRIRAALRRARVLTPEMEDDLERRVRVVCGDLTRHDLGLPHRQWIELSESTHAVIHNGALVNYVLGYDALKPHNVDGTRGLIRFASAGLAKEFHFISSTFIYGWSPKGVLYETDDNAAMENLDFGYAQSKWVAEQLVLSAGKSGLDVRVYRPSLISASSNGVGSRDDIAVRLLAFMITHGVAPIADNQISFLPADVAADNISAIVMERGLSGSTFHVTVDDYYSMVDVAREITRAYGFPFTYYPIPEFVAEMNRRCTKADPVFPLLDFFTRSHPKISAMQHKRYDNDAYRGARNRSESGRSDPKLSETVSYMMRFLLDEELIPAAIHESIKNPT